MVGIRDQFPQYLQREGTRAGVGNTWGLFRVHLLSMVEANETNILKFSPLFLSESLLKTKS